MAKKRSEIADVDRSLYDFRFSDADAEKLAAGGRTDTRRRRRKKTIDSSKIRIWNSDRNTSHKKPSLNKIDTVYTKCIHLSRGLLLSGSLRRRKLWKDGILQTWEPLRSARWKPEEDGSDHRGTLPGAVLIGAGPLALSDIDP